MCILCMCTTFLCVLYALYVYVLYVFDGVQVIQSGKVFSLGLSVCGSAAEGQTLIWVYI